MPQTWDLELGRSLAHLANSVNAFLFFWIPDPARLLVSLGLRNGGCIPHRTLLASLGALALLDSMILILGGLGVGDTSDSVLYVKVTQLLALPLLETSNVIRDPIAANFEIGIF